MTLKDISFATPQENILFDDVLLALAEKGEAGEILRFWESAQPFIVLGRIGQAQEDVDAANAARDRIAVVRRSSGGGTVVQGPGCLNYTLVLSKKFHRDISDLRKSYQLISQYVINAVHELGVDAVFRPTSDIALRQGEQKFSGNAQRRGKNFILHHGTILYNFDLNLIPTYLKMPKDIPEYRRARSHLDFVTNIPIVPEEFKRAFSRSLGIQAHPSELNQQEQQHSDCAYSRRDQQQQAQHQHGWRTWARASRLSRSPLIPNP